MDSYTVDARGLSCPQPLMMVMKALAAQSGPITVSVDTASASESISRTLKKEKRKVTSNYTDGETTFQIGPKP
jgi:TusA-related sulfurtransferase